MSVTPARMMVAKGEVASRIPLLNARGQILQAGAGIRGRQKRVWKTRWSRESCEGLEGREEGMMGEWTS